MSEFEWRDEYSVNIESMDEQHKKMVKLINTLDLSIKLGNDQTILADALDGLIDYVKTHFADEEKLMQEHEYPDYYAHRQAHIDMTLKAVELKNRHNDYRPADINATIEFLVHWLVSHIMGTDKQYGVYINKKLSV